MPKLRAELEGVVTRLLTMSDAGGTLPLDAIGDALGAMAVSMDEIDAILTILEESGRQVVGAHGPGAEANLRLVVAAARELKNRLDRRPTVHEVAAQAGLTSEQTLVALSLLRIMQR